MSTKTRSARRLSPAKVRRKADTLGTDQEPPREICIISKGEMFKLISEAVSRVTPQHASDSTMVPSVAGNALKLGEYIGPHRGSQAEAMVSADPPTGATLPQLHRELEIIHMRCNELCARFSVSVERLTGHTHIPASPSETSAKNGQLAQLHRVTQDVHRLLHTLDGIARHLDELTAES